ncbi:hypothetical protein SPH9361_03285 [Sphingobium sp. CECT 9361]|nr:hypothetical protein SPH9361_03285 [Sphingobium sp. CECT 9361]
MKWWILYVFNGRFAETKLFLSADMATTGSRLPDDDRAEGGGPYAY